MGILDDIAQALKDLVSSKGMSPTGYTDPLTEASPAPFNPYTGEIITPSAKGTPTGGTFLLKTAIALGAISAAPAIYALYNQRRTKKHRVKDITEDGMFLALEGASNRATSLIAGILPAFALPIAYIGVEELEERAIISGPLGDDVQTLMAAGVIAPAVGNVIGSVVSAATRRK